MYTRGTESGHIAGFPNDSGNLTETIEKCLILDLTTAGKRHV